ncbi:penicillin-insensitive murein endopeptidase [Paracoccus sp. (in: a-proteobacteria)]|uniref:penicillin-insensitive murein endopeptidase n=1 Tax=Paracoccus sp. TaxID=267 RepID=UPI0026DED227|nr:penicillin-insensitive murein endopeptidase [Paracoccus sp. (in: a-proteobacteria)]MDO5368890.1 penicillin-insensitive murein endopeptidase [Paracoccus sp. (in: a-proteobacteria)]
MLAALALSVLALPAAADPLAKDVFGAFRQSNGGPAGAFGGYSRGCATGNVALPETGPTWQAMRLSRNRNWGHPQLVDFLVGLSQQATRHGWAGLYIGDMSQPMGGPMLTGHASHQIGLDADIWMLPPASLQLTPSQRENISSQSVVARGGTQLSPLWSASHHAILRAAASDPRVARIFVDPVAKLAMCQSERGNRAYLRKIRPIDGHDYHFHVRLSCPNQGCENQAAPPPGDGCEEAAQWIRNRIDPPPPAPPNPDYRHPRTYRLSELPGTCQALVAR